MIPPNPDFQKAIQELQDAAIVTGHIEKRHTELLKDHEEILRKHARMLAAQSDAALALIENHIAFEKEMREVRADAEKFRRRTDQNLAEITDKLNGLIGYVAGMQHPPK